VLLYSEKSEGLHEDHSISLNIMKFNATVIDRFVNVKKEEWTFYTNKIGNDVMSYVLDDILKSVVLELK
jgi:hypothetical protein